MEKERDNVCFLTNSCYLNKSKWTMQTTKISVYYLLITLPSLVKSINLFKILPLVLLPIVIGIFISLSLITCLSELNAEREKWDNIYMRWKILLTVLMQIKYFVSCLVTLTRLKRTLKDLKFPSLKLKINLHSQLMIGCWGKESIMSVFYKMLVSRNSLTQAR